jgi:hypothetical protein
VIVATRELTAICKSGERKPVALRIEVPVETDGTWRCWYEIDWPEDGWPAQTTRSSAPGADAMQAIQLGLMKLGAELHFSSYHREGKLYWNDGQVGYGMIVPKDARDLLRGDDAGMLG